MENRCKREVIDLHEFFVNWFTGKEADMSRFERALAPHFQIINPSGRLISRPDLLKAMGAAKGQFAETPFQNLDRSCPGPALGNGLVFSDLSRMANQGRGKPKVGNLRRCWLVSALVQTV